MHAEEFRVIPGTPDLREKISNGRDPRNYFHGIVSAAFQHCTEFFRCAVKSGITGHGSTDHLYLRVGIQIVRNFFRLVCLKNRFVETFQLSHTAACADDQITFIEAFFCLTG